MTYTYGQSAQKPRVVAMTADQVRAEMENLNRLKAAILAESAAKAKELERIRAARKRLQPVATYKPTPEALAYREQYGHIIAAQPAPMHGGLRGLRMAAAEAAAHDARKNGRVA
jgi:hypothetical protein